MKRIALMLILIMPSFAWAENYLCISDKVTGFKFMDDTWQTTGFKTGDKYIVSTEALTVTKFGEQGPLHIKCESSPEIFFCDYSFGLFRMNPKNLRYMLNWPVGVYEFPNPDNSGTPYMEIGTCSKF